jgi:peptidoglycan/xylan/chitin deacetylase (PgdA/CDA1 family)
MVRLPTRRLLAPLTLAYHGVNTIDPADNAMELVMAPAYLESQVRFLQRLGYRFATAEEVAATGRPQARGTAVLTFDDGWRDALTVVAPLLTRLGVRATFYVNPGLWGGRHQLVTGDAGRLLSADEARALVCDAGMELGAHSMRHDDLRTLDDATLAADLADGKAAVEEVTGRPCATLAYPFGAYDERVQRATAAAGYTLAWAWLPGPWTPLAAPRLPGPTRSGAARLAVKMTGVRRTQAVGPVAGSSG